MKPAIRVENLSKSYRLGSRASGGYRTLRETITDSVAGVWDSLRRRGGFSINGGSKGSTKNDSFWALKDVSFEVQPGEVVGIIGRNGAGKSTLLKILSRITEPTAGRCEFRGRMGSLLEVGTGFHPELSGRENIYMNGSLLGMRREEISRRFAEIVAFAEMEQFLDTPVKRYSSGMYVRLAFSVAAHLDPEILIVDEVLAVGDASYQRRCLDRMSSLANEGRTVLFVSHNMQLIPRLCQSAILLESGRVRELGNATAVTQCYLNQLLKESSVGDLRDRRRTGDGRARFIRAVLVDNEGQEIGTTVSSDDLIVRMEVESYQSVSNVALAVVIQNVYGMRVFTSWTQEVGYQVSLKPGKQTFECGFKNVNLRPGRTVMISVWMAAESVIDYVESAMVTEVVGDERHQHLSTSLDQGIVIYDYEWREVAGKNTTKENSEQLSLRD